MPEVKKYLSKIVKASNTLYIKDAEAQADIADIKSSITGGMHYRGKSTTAIADGDATGPWVIDGVTYVASGATGEQENLAAGDLAIYGELEFIWSGAAGKWQEFGSTGSLKALAFKDDATGTYTPAGTNAPSAVSFTGGQTGNFVTGYNDDAVAPTFSEGTFSAGSLPSFTEGAFSAGSLPSFTEGEFDAGALPSFTEGAFDAGSLPSKTADTFSAGSLPSLGDATTGNFATAGETSSYDETNECLTFSDATLGAAVTAQGTFSAGTLPSYTEGTFTAGTLPSKAADTWSAGSLPSKEADTWSAGTLPSKGADTWNAGSLPSKAADTFTAGSAATLATAAAVTNIGTAEAAAQVFTGTEGTVTVE